MEFASLFRDHPTIRYGILLQAMHDDQYKGFGQRDDQYLEVQVSTGSLHSAQE